MKRFLCLFLTMGLVVTTPALGKACFFSFTNIKLADGTTKIARKIRRGDPLWNPVTRRAVIVSSVKAMPEYHALYEVVTKKSSMIVSEGHPVVTLSGRTRIEKVRTGNHLLHSGDEYSPVTSLRRIPVSDPVPIVWNFTFNDTSMDPRDHFVSANNIVAGNYILKSRMQRRPIPYMLP